MPPYRSLQISSPAREDVIGRASRGTTSSASIPLSAWISRGGRRAPGRLAGGCAPRMATARMPRRPPTTRHEASIGQKPSCPSLTISRSSHGAADPSGPATSPIAKANGTTERVPAPRTNGQGSGPRRPAHVSQTCAVGTRSSARYGFASQEMKTARVETAPRAGTAAALGRTAGTRQPLIP